MLNSYIIEKNKLLGDVIVDIKEQYPNHLFKFNLLDYSNLVSIITDQSLRDLAQTIHVPVKSIATTSRIKRLKSINTILFIIDDVSIIKNEQIQNFIGEELYKQYLKENIDAITENTGSSNIDINSVREYLIPK